MWLREVVQLIQQIQQISYFVLNLKHLRVVAIERQPRDFLFVAYKKNVCYVRVMKGSRQSPQKKLHESAADKYNLHNVPQAYGGFAFFCVLAESEGSRQIPRLRGKRCLPKKPFKARYKGM